MVDPGHASAQQSLDLASYIAHLPADVRASLFASSWTAQALFRALSPLAKQYILRLVYVDATVSKDSISTWIRPSAKAQHHDTLQQLEQLAVLQADWQGGVQLNPDFKRCLRAALSGRGLGADEGARQARCYQGTPPVRKLKEQAARQWQAVLMYILDADAGLPIGNTDATGFNIHDLLLAAGLVRASDYSKAGGAWAHDRHELTPEGLRYLLQPTSEQVWLLLREYIRRAEQAAVKHTGEGLAATLSFLMQLSFRRVWQPYALEALSPAEQAIAGHMGQLGLVATCSQDGATYFCATPLAASLCGGSGAPGEGGGAAADGGAAGGGGSSTLENSAYIIVETNFRVYAHTSSPLQRLVLRRLMRPDCVLPNLFVGTLTREAFMAALDAGLSAADVSRFLQAHAHPQAARRVPAVPRNVVEQLALWEGETRRVAAQPVTLYGDFGGDEDLFLAALHHAQGLGSVLWADGPTRRFLVARSSHEAVRNFIVEYKAQRARHQAL